MMGRNNAEKPFLDCGQLEGLRKCVLPTRTANEA